MNYDEWKLQTPPDDPPWMDEYWEKELSYKICPVCGEYLHEDSFILTTDGLMCRDCFEYLKECDDSFIRPIHKIEP